MFVSFVCWVRKSGSFCPKLVLPRNGELAFVPSLTSMRTNNYPRLKIEFVPNELNELKSVRLISEVLKTSYNE